MLNEVTKVPNSININHSVLVEKVYACPLFSTQLVIVFKPSDQLPVVIQHIFIRIVDHAKFFIVLELLL